MRYFRYWKYTKTIDHRRIRELIPDKVNWLISTRPWNDAQMYDFLSLLILCIFIWSASCQVKQTLTLRHGCLNKISSNVILTINMSTAPNDSDIVDNFYNLQNKLKVTNKPNWKRLLYSDYIHKWPQYDNTTAIQHFLRFHGLNFWLRMV